MLRTAVLIYLALVALCSACVEAFSMTQPMQGRFPSEDWTYWHLIVFTLSVALLAVAVGLIRVQRRWWFVTAAFSPLMIAGGLLLSSSRSLILGYDSNSPRSTTYGCGVCTESFSRAVVDSDFDPLGSGAAIH